MVLKIQWGDEKRLRSIFSETDWNFDWNCLELVAF